jgi:hypothetical protein
MPVKKKSITNPMLIEAPKAPMPSEAPPIILPLMIKPVKKRNSKKK